MTRRYQTMRPNQSMTWGEVITVGVTALVVVLCFLVIVVLFFATGGSVRARDLGQWKYASPDTAAYFASLMQPDSPNVSCCGAADAYWADKTETAPDGGVIAIITDTRNDVLLKREHIPVGTRIAVPASKIRKHPIPNPTDHTIIFVGGQDGWRNVYCFEPLPQG